VFNGAKIRNRLARSDALAGDVDCRALEHHLIQHARDYGLPEDSAAWSRVVYVIPYTSIIEQTADVFRTALDTKDDILEHHASFDWERAKDLREADDEGADGLKKLRLAAENWDVPIVVTTAVQVDGFKAGFAIDDRHELAPEPKRLYICCW
jgi:hypothetical protein